MHGDEKKNQQFFEELLKEARVSLEVGTCIIGGHRQSYM